MEKNIFTDFFDFLIEAIKVIASAIAIIAVFVIQFALWIAGVIFSVWILKLVFGLFGIHFSIGF